MTIQQQTQEIQDPRLAVLQGLQPARSSGMLAGFGNMLGKEMSEWFHTRRWLFQSLIWLIIINGIVGFILFLAPLLEPFLPGLNASLVQSLGSMPPIAKSLNYYFIFTVAAGTVGVIILAQDEIIQEKESGTTAWILSKPASRPAFILTKLLSNTIGALIFIIALPGLVAIVETYLSLHLTVQLVPFLGGVGVAMLALFFYISLVIMLGVVCESRGPVLGIAFGTIFGGMALANFIPYIAYVLPISMDKIALFIALGMPLPPIFTSQLISTAVMSVIFILVALRRFQRLEF